MDEKDGIAPPPEPIPFPDPPKPINYAPYIVGGFAFIGLVLFFTLRPSTSPPSDHFMFGNTDVHLTKDVPLNAHVTTIKFDKGDFTKKAYQAQTDSCVHFEPLDRITAEAQAPSNTRIFFTRRPNDDGSAFLLTLKEWPQSQHPC